MSMEFSGFLVGQFLLVLFQSLNFINFYSWFCDAENQGFNDASRRGLSTRGYKFLGIIAFPKLTLTQFKVCLLFYMLSLIIMLMDISLPFFRISSCLLWLLIASSLWAETLLSFHREALSTLVHIYLALWPQQWIPANIMIKLIQIHIASIYFPSAVQKVLCSIFQKRPRGSWFLYSATGFIWDSSWGTNLKFQFWQRLFIKHPLLLGMMGGLGCLVMQFSLLPYVLLGEGYYLKFYFVILIVFHATIYIMKGVNYIFWLQLIFALVCSESFGLNLPPFMSTPIEQVGIGLSPNTINYFSTHDILSSDFIMFGVYNAKLPVGIPFNSGQFVTKEAFIHTVKTCQFSIVRPLNEKEPDFLFYFISSREDWVREESVVKEFIDTIEFLRSKNQQAQIWNSENIIECFERQDRCREI
eukprot:Pgem_evm1s16042